MNSVPGSKPLSDSYTAETLRYASCIEMDGELFELEEIVADDGVTVVAILKALKPCRKPYHVVKLDADDVERIAGE